PVDMYAIGGDVLDWPERDAGMKVSPAFELAQRLARFTADEPYAVGQFDLRQYSAQHVTFRRHLADVARQPARVLHDQADVPGIRSGRCDLGRADFELRRDQRLPQQPLRKARDLFLAQGGRGVGKYRHPVPAADLDLAELWMLEWSPGHVSGVVRVRRCDALRPFVGLEVVLDRMVTEPVDPVLVVDAGFFLRIPDLDGPDVHAEMLVDPVKRTADVFAGVVLELVPDRDRRIAGQLFTLLADGLVGPQVLGRQLVVRSVAERSQQHAREGVDAGAAADVRVLDEKVHHRAHLGFRRRIRTGAELLEFLSPVRREVAVQVEALRVAEHAGDLDRAAVGACDAS